ncbi:tetratricopeptide repeat protein [Kitasatospora griseola]|uniref:tetratricopeptide repeat protein n=1 Tax=Kitasatospora griseola TaxID=2064 RepID=UPI0038064D8D
MTQYVQAGQAFVLPPEAYAPIPADAARGGVSNIRGGLFVGRADELALLERAFEQAGEVVVHAVHGLGGVGKSALAAQWASLRGESVRWRIVSDTRAGVRAGLAELARALQPGLTGLPEELQAERTVRWLADHDGWLLVLDNVDDPADIAALLDRIPRGRVLITTRRASGWHHRATTVRLDVLRAGDSVDLFVRVLTHDGPREADGADAVCEEVGHLALGVEQAAAYCAQNGTVPREYLTMLTASPANMFAARAEGTDPERTVARIWRLTLDRLADTPLAGEILRILAWYAPDSIPRSLLDGLAARPEVTAALGRLLAYNMVADNRDGTVSVHRLVQTLARTPDPGDPHRQAHDIDRARDRATVLLTGALPDDSDPPETWPRYRALLPHADALVGRHAPDHDTAETAYVLDRAAAFRRVQGVSASAIPAFGRALASRERILGDDHPDTVASRNNLATAYQAVGDPGRAVPLLERAVLDSERILGSDHPHTLVSRNNLATAYEAVGDLGRAIGVHERALRDRERVIGDDHPHTLTSRSNLANAYQAAGDLGRAVPLHERTLRDRERILGDDHPDTLASRNNLAVAYEAAGEPGRAIDLHERSVLDSERVLGGDHPQTQTSRNNLAAAYQAAGDLGRAIPLLERAVLDSERILGSDHPHTLVSRNNLASAYQAAGNPTRAIPLLERAVLDSEHILGSDHPHTLASRNNLATAYQEAGEPGRAIPLLERVVIDSERVLGGDHPQTQSARNNLAAICVANGDLGRAIGLFEQVLAVMERVHGTYRSPTLSAHIHLLEVATALIDRGRTLLPEDPAGAWQDAAAVVQAVGPHLAGAPAVYKRALARAYLLAADALDADGQPEAADDYRRRAANTT